MRCNRRGNDEGEQSQFTPSTRESGEPKTNPFAQRAIRTRGRELARSANSRPPSAQYQIALHSALMARSSIFLLSSHCINERSRSVLTLATIRSEILCCRVRR
jgi:hypothetical protein